MTTRITTELLELHGFKPTGVSGNYIRECHEDRSVLIINTFRKEMYGCDYYETYLGIDIYTFEDLKMLWFLKTRQNLEKEKGIEVIQPFEQFTYPK